MPARLGGKTIDIPILSEMYSDVLQYFSKLPSLIVVLIIGVTLIRFAQHSIGRLLQLARLDRALIQFVSTFLAFAGWVFLISLIFSILGFPQLSLAFSGSIALVLLGVATNATNLIQDLLAGIFLIAEPDFTVGRKIRVLSVVGTIVGLDIKKTKVADESGHVHFVPNKVFDANVFVIENKDNMAGEPDTIQRA